MGCSSLCLLLVAGLFVAVDSVSVYRDEITGVIYRQKRGFQNQQPMQPQNQNLRTEIADSISVQKPNLNHNIGATSSTSIGNSALINNGQNGGSPSLKLGQGLAVAISIQGPEGAATKDTFDNTQMFNTGAGDVGQSFANAGNTSPHSNTANTGVNVQLQGNPNGSGSASTFNKANVNMFNVRGGNGGQTGTAQSFGGANGK